MNRSSEPSAGPIALRLFVALAVPEAVREKMARMQDRLRPLAAPGDVRWVAPEQFHLTLKFLGAVAADRLDAVTKSLAEACAGTAPFRLRAKGIGFFPHARSPRVLWIGIEDAEDRLTAFQRRVERLLSPWAEGPAENFRAHVTLGRFQKFRRHKTDRLAPAAMSSAGDSFGEWRAEQVDLMRSELSPAGAVHTVLSSTSLK